jgi:protoheme IX farnesyltransferase
LLERVKAYYEVTKPRVWYLLVFTALGGYVVAAGRSIDPYLFAITIIAVTLGSAGANAITCYIDRDIDAVMNRTRLRPIPTRRIYPAKKALYYGLALALAAVTLALLINLIAALLMIFGLVDNIIIYSKLLKRRNPVSIILGGFSGGAPALIGYAAVKNTIDLTSLLMAALVVLWIPGHIWSLALYARDDYAKAKVPMLPVVVSESVAVRCIASTSILMVAFSISIYFVGAFGAIYLTAAAILGALALAVNFWLVVKPSKERAWVGFKLSSPYLALIFLAMMLDKIFT